MTPPTEAPRYSWTQPACDTCFAGTHSGIEPYRIKDEYRDEERCCMCGATVRNGIYVRIDPKDALYPTLEK